MTSKSPTFTLWTNAFHSALLNSSVAFVGSLESRTATPWESRATITQQNGLWSLYVPLTKSRSWNLVFLVRMMVNPCAEMNCVGLAEVPEKHFLHKNYTILFILK